jgi:myo-inositol catabolism protein IolH
MKLALDPHMIRQLSLPDVVRQVANLGFEYLELTPRPDFLPFYTHPRVDDESIQLFKRTLSATKVRMVAAAFGDYRWSSPNEEIRQAAVRYWLRALEVLADVECSTVMSELGGQPEQGEVCEAALWRSLDQLLPRHEELGIALNLQAHPNNFIESNDTAVDFVRGINHPLVGYCFVTAHTFHLGQDVEAMIRYAGPTLRHVLIADTSNYQASSGLRFIVNPHGAPVRVHQHLQIGDGEVDFDSVFKALADVKFSGIMTSNVYSQEERALDVYLHDRAAIAALAKRHRLPL